MKKLLSILLALSLTLSLGTLFACSDDPSNPPQYPPVSADAWADAFNFAQTDNEYEYTVTVKGTTAVIGYKNGSVVSRVATGQTIVMLAVYCENNSFYTYSRFTTWEEYYTKECYTWGDYCVPVATTQDFRDNVRDYYLSFGLIGNCSYEDFTYDFEKEKFVADAIDVLGVTFTDVSVSFDQQNQQFTVNFVLPDTTPTQVTMSFELNKTVQIPNAGKVVTYPLAEEYKDAFDLTAENFVAVYKKYPQHNENVFTTTYIKDGDKIYVEVEETGNRYVRNYYEKEGDKYYNYTGIPGLWSKSEITEDDYKEALNYIINIVLTANRDYSYDNMVTNESMKYHSVYATGSAKVITILCANNKVDRLIIGNPVDPDAYIDFTYGHANVALPTVNA